MSGHRFARNGRCRFLICCGMLVLIIGMVAIFHSSQIQLDESREQRLYCEQQQEVLNERLEDLIQQKLRIEKHHERERNEDLNNKHNLEQTIKELEAKIEKDKLEHNNLEHVYKQLQSNHDTLKTEYTKVRKQYQEEKLKLEENLKHITLEMKHDNGVQLEETKMWKDKYNSIMHEQIDVETSINKQEVEKLRAEIKTLEMELQRYNVIGDAANGGHAMTEILQQQNNTIHNPYNNNNNNIEVNRNELVSRKSFTKQDTVGNGVYHIPINLTERSLLSQQTNENTNTNFNNNSNNYTDLTKTGDNDDYQLKIAQTTTRKMAKKFKKHNKHNNHSLILNSVENFQIVPKLIKTQDYNLNSNNKIQHNVVTPLEAPKSLIAQHQYQQQQHQIIASSSSPATRSEQQVPTAIMVVVDTNSSTTITSKHLSDIEQQRNRTNRSSISPLLALQSKKLPENVAPIPDNFHTFLNEAHNGNVNAHQPQAPPQLQQEQPSIISDDKKIVEPKIQALKYIIANNKKHNYDEIGPQYRKDPQGISNENSFLSQYNNDNDDNNQLKLDIQNKVIDTRIDNGHNLSNNNINNNNDDDDNNSEIGLGDNGQGVRVNDGDHDNAMASLGGAAAGDIVVQQSNKKENQQLRQQQLQEHSLDSNNLNNEVAADQGKEFGDGGLRIDEGDMDDGDDDDYLNPGDRLQGGGKAIRA